MSEQPPARSVSEILFRELYAESGQLLDRQEAVAEEIAAAIQSVERLSLKVSEQFTETSKDACFQLMRETKLLLAQADTLRSHAESIAQTSNTLAWKTFLLGSVAGIVGGALAALALSAL